MRRYPQFRLHGTPRDVGRQHGRAVRDVLPRVVDEYLEHGLISAGKLDTDRLRRSALAWLAALPAHFRQELEGLAEGAGLTLQRIAEYEFAEAARIGCTAACVRIGRRYWVARNNDTDDYGLSSAACTLVREIPGRLPTIALGTMGDTCLITGLNAEHIWVHVHALQASDCPSGAKPVLPCCYLAREVLETARSLEDVEDTLNRFDRDEGLTLVVVDGRAEAAAAFQCTRTQYLRCTGSGDALVVANHALAPANGLPVVDSGSGRVPTSTDRAARLSSLLAAHAGALSPEVLQRMLADEGLERRDHDFATVHSAVACPSTGEIWFSAGHPSASAGHWDLIACPW